MTDASIIYRRLVENMNEGVWMGDKDEKTVYANPKFCQMMGYTLAEMIGRPSYDFWDKESSDRVRHVNEGHRKRGESSSYEGNLLTKDGEKIPVLLSGTPLPDGGTIGIMTDLRELKKNESVYRRLVEHMNEGVWMGDKHEKTVYANPKFCQMMGYTLMEMLGRPSYDFWDKESARKVKHVNMTYLKVGVSSAYEGNLLTKQGKKIPVLLSGTPLPDGGTIGIMTDLRELKKREHQERLLGAAIQHALDIIVILDNDANILSWNKGAKIAFGHSAQKIIGQSIQILFPGEQIMELLSSSRRTQTIEIIGKHKNGATVTLSATLSPISSSNDHFDHSWLLIARDVSSQRSFEEELSRRYDKLRDAYNKFGIARRQIDYIFELISLSLQGKSEQLVADFIVNAVVMLTRVDACSLRIYDAKHQTLTLLSSFGLGEDWRGKKVIAYKHSVVKRAFEKRAPLKIIDLASDPSYHSKNLARKSNFSSMLSIPLILRGRLLGSLSLYVGPEKKMEILENEFIEKYAELVSVVLGSFNP